MDLLKKRVFVIFAFRLAQFILEINLVYFKSIPLPVLKIEQFFYTLVKFKLPAIIRYHGNQSCLLQKFVKNRGIFSQQSPQNYSKIFL